MPVDLLSNVTRNTQNIQPKDLLTPQKKEPVDLISTLSPSNNIPIGTFQYDKQEQAARQRNPILWKAIDIMVPGLKPALRGEPPAKVLEPTFDEFLKGINIPTQVIHAHPIASVGLNLATAQWTPGYPGKERLQQFFEPKTVVADITNRVASLFGLWKGIKILNRTMPWMSLSGWKPTTQIGGLARHLLHGGMKIGTYNLLTESGGRTLIENMKLRGISTVMGFGIGAVFEATGLFSGELVRSVAGRTFHMAIKDVTAQKAAFIMRLGANQMFTGVPALKRFVRGEEHIPGLIFSIGLGTMFSLSENPLKTETEFNKFVIARNKLKGLTTKQLIKQIEKAGTVNNVPTDIKWAYIMKTTRVKPSYQNAGDMLENEYLRFRDPVEWNRRLTTGQIKNNIGATNYIFEQALKINNPVTHGKLNFVQSVMTDIEKEMLAQVKVPTTEETTAITKMVTEGRVTPTPVTPTPVTPTPVTPTPVTPTPVTPTPTPTVSASEVPKGTINTFGILPGATRKFAVGGVENDLGIGFGTEQSFGKVKGKKQAVQLDITNPLVVKDPMAWDNPKAVLDTIFNAGALSKHEYLSMRSRIPSIKDIKYKNRNGTFNPDRFYAAQDMWYKVTRQLLTEKGYDTIIYKNEAEDPGAWSFKVLKDDVIKKPVDISQAHAGGKALVPEQREKRIFVVDPDELDKYGTNIAKTRTGNILYINKLLNNEKVGPYLYEPYMAAQQNLWAHFKRTQGQRLYSDIFIVKTPEGTYSIQWRGVLKPNALPGDESPTAFIEEIMAPKSPKLPTTQLKEIITKQATEGIKYENIPRTFLSKWKVKVKGTEGEDWTDVIIVASVKKTPTPAEFDYAIGKLMNALPDGGDIYDAYKGGTLPTGWGITSITKSKDNKSIIMRIYNAADERVDMKATQTITPLEPGHDIQKYPYYIGKQEKIYAKFPKVNPKTVEFISLDPDSGEVSGMMGGKNMAGILSQDKIEELIKKLSGDILREGEQPVGREQKKGKEPLLPTTRQITEITSKIKVGGKDVTTGHAWYEGPTLHLGYLETQPDYQRRGLGTRVIHNLINEALKTNKGLVGVEGFIQSEGGARVLDNFGAKFFDAGKNLLTNEQAINKARAGEEVNYKIDFRSTDFISSKAGQEMPWLSWVPRELAKQEDNLRAELATGKDITKLRKTARSIGLLYKSKDNKEVRNRLNTFLMDYYNIKYDKLNTLTGAQIEEARKLMQQLTPDSSGRIKLPKTTEILPIDLIQEFRRKGNLFDWLQSGRIAVRPIYDLFKPAYQNMLLSREAKLDALRDIYKNKVKRGSEIDQKLALYADGKINLDDIPKEYREIAIGRQDFYDKYADTLIERGFLDKKKVFNKDGTRKPYYHRIFDDVITRAYREGYAIEDLWLPGKLPTAGPLRKRLGKGGYKLSAIESDTEYVYAIEKYLNLKDANDAAIKYAQQYSGIRKSQADTYIRAMRGQPTKFDRQIKEAIQNISDGTADLLEKIGLKEQAKKLKEWSAPAYPLSRITSPLARFYYWRYIGFALDTAFKNSIQWEHAAARYGWENVTRAFYDQFTPEGKELIKDSGILREGIQRSRHFVEESGVTQKFNKIEQAAYLAWEKFETQNRQVSGLAAYYESVKQGKSYEQSMQAMRDGSHETQYGYTKADSLLMDMSNPVWRFILFKKWPLAKVEMIRGWIKENRRDAVFNLAMQEYLMYRIAQGVGIDLGGQFNAIWQLATRGLSTPTDLIPLVGDITNIIKAFGTGPEADKAGERLINNWQGLGNRYIGKMMNFWRAWQDDWNVREHEGQLKYQSTPKEQLTLLLTTPQEATERRVQMNRMRAVGNDVDAYREKAIRQVLAGNTEGAGKTMQEMLDKYSDEFAEYYGKTLEPINMDDVRRYMVNQQIPILEKVRKQLPGKGAKPPAGYKFPTRKAKDLIGAIRGY